MVRMVAATVFVLIAQNRRLNRGQIRPEAVAVEVILSYLCNILTLGLRFEHVTSGVEIAYICFNRCGVLVLLHV